MAQAKDTASVWRMPTNNWFAALSSQDPAMVLVPFVLEKCSPGISLPGELVKSPS